MHAIGSATISLKVGSKIIFYLSAAEAAGNIFSASETGNVDYTLKVTAVESASLAGGVIGGGLGASAGAEIGSAIGLVLAPFTGGLSVPVLTVAGVVIGTVGGGIAGTFIFNKGSKEITKICD